MALWSSSRPGIRARALVRIPATLTGDGGIDVSKVSGTWTISPDWTVLDLITSSSVAQTQQVWVFDPTAETYSRVALSSVVQALGYTGSGISLNFTADLSATSDADPGAGKLRFNNASQNAATVLYIDDLDTYGMNLTTLVPTLDDSSSTVKGHISITKVGDATKRLIFVMTALTDAAGYTKLTVSCLASSATNPFTEGDTLLFNFARNGDATPGTVELSTLDLAGADQTATLAVGDFVPFHRISGGSNHIITLTNFFKVIDGLTAETAPDVADELLLYDASASTADKITTLNFFKVINTFTADATPDNSADYVVTYDASATAAKKVLLQKIVIGKQTVGAAAGSLFPATTNGCAALQQAETSTNKINYKYLAFDPTSIENAWCAIPTPKSIAIASGLTARIAWTHPATTVNFGVTWQIEILSLTDDDAIDTAVGTAVTVTDTGGTTQDFYTSTAFATITPSNTLAKQDWLFIRVSRKATDAADTLAVDAHLIGVEFYYTTDTSTDD